MSKFSELQSSHSDIRFKPAAEFSQSHGGFHKDNLKAGLMALPATAEQVGELLSSCNKLGIPVVPQGGRTGLSGAACTSPQELIIDTSLLNAVIDLDPVGGSAIVESGVTLAELEARANQHHLTCGIDLAARDSATVGGMVATNAGGIEAFRNGVMRHRVLGLEAALADGRLFSDLKRVTKANEGYDLKQLFIGAEGTLGVVTKVVLSLLPKPPESRTAMVSCENAEEAVRLFRNLRNHSQLGLLSAEIMWPEYAAAVATEVGLASTLAFDGDANSILVLLEVSAETTEKEEAFQEVLMHCIEQGEIRNAVIAKSEKERKDMWRIREDSFAIDDSYPNGFWFDMSVPLDSLANYARKIAKNISAISPDLKLFLFAHLGDGNFHATVSTGYHAPELESDITAVMYEGLEEMGGSFSAEHGIGLEKRSSLQKYAPEVNLSLMREIKQLLDPNGIMNPGKVL